MSLENVSRGINPRQASVIAGAGILGVALSAAFVWKVMAAPSRAEPGRRSADEVRLSERAQKEKARAEAQARKIRQSEVGQGMRFDAEGNLVEALPEGLSDLPANRALDEAASLPPPSDEIARGIVKPRRSPSHGGYDPTEEEFGAEDEAVTAGRGGRGVATDDEGGRVGDAPGPMLGYSTVRSAKWATRRPELGDERGASAAPKATAKDREDAAMDRVVQAMEESVRREGAPTPGAPAPGLTGPAAAGLWTNGPQVSPGPSSRGEALYAENGAPAEQAPQAFAAGGIGDMRIGGNVGPDHVVRQGKFLDCVLVTRLRADLVDSPVIAMVSRDYVSLDGKYVLVPAGTKLLGSAGAVGNLQQARVYIKFDRLIYPDQRSAYFPIRKVTAVDGEGAVGIEGDVNRHFMLQFGAAVMLGMLDGLAAAVQGPGSAGQPTLRELVAARTSTNLSTVVAGVIQKYANVVPTITVEPGAAMKVFFSEDVRMSPYLTTSELSWLRGRR